MELPPGLRLSVEQNPSWEDRELIDNGLGDYNAAFLRDNSYDYFGIFVRGDAGAIRAGLIGHVYAGWLFVNLLWVHADLRRGGIGRGLLAEAARRSPRLPFGLARHLLVPGARILSETRLSGICPARLPARPPAHLPEKAIARGVALRRRIMPLPPGCRFS